MTERVTLKVRGQAIFDEELSKRANGAFDTNKAFRKSVIGRMVTEMGVSTASASAMYNQSKQLAEAADSTVSLGRDPKKVTVKVATPTVAIPDQAEAATGEGEVTV